MIRPEALFPLDLQDKIFPVFSGVYQRRPQTRAVGTENVGFDIIANDQRIGRSNIQRAADPVEKVG